MIVRDCPRPQVAIDSMDAGLVVITVAGFSVPFGPQNYSLAVQACSAGFRIISKPWSQSNRESRHALWPCGLHGISTWAHHEFGCSRHL